MINVIQESPLLSLPISEHDHLKLSEFPDTLLPVNGLIAVHTGFVISIENIIPVVNSELSVIKNTLLSPVVLYVVPPVYDAPPIVLDSTFVASNVKITPVLYAQPLVTTLPSNVTQLNDVIE